MMPPKTKPVKRGKKERSAEQREQMRVQMQVMRELPPPRGGLIPILNETFDRLALIGQELEARLLHPKERR